MTNRQDLLKSQLKRCEFVRNKSRINNFFDFDVRGQQTGGSTIKDCVYVLATSFNDGFVSYKWAACHLRH